jgi:peptidoglycan/LPS O-acetylase OafA/YrhL
MKEQRPAQIGLDNHDEALSVWLDLFRWAAAFAVVLSHVSHRMFIRFHEVPHDARPPALYLFGGVSSFGEPAVIIFFVMSGFLVGGSSLRRYKQKGTFDFTSYMLARFSRLWVVLIPALLLSYVLDVVSAGLTGETPLPFVADFDRLVCNVGFLQTAVCFQYRENGALWSLFNEFWYYVAWPPVMLAIWSKQDLAKRAALLAVPVVLLTVLAAIQFVGANIAVYFLIWALGVVAADRAKPFVSMPPWLAAVLFFGFLAIWRVYSSSDVLGENFLQQFPSDLTMTLLFANMLMNMKQAKRLPFPPLRRWHQPIAGFSFTMYCTHTPIINCFGMFLLWAFGTGWHMLPVGPEPYVIYLITVAVCVLSAYLISLVTERHTPQIRALLESRIRQLKMA